MEYKVSGIIKFFEVSKLKLDNNKLIFNFPSSIKVTISSTDTNDLNVELILSADNESEAKMIAELKVEQISNLISYFHNIPIAENRITSIVSQSQTSPNEKNIKITEFAYFSESLSIVKGLNPESIEKLKNKLEKDYSDDFEGIILLWRQAISADAPTLRYLLFYRLLELLFNSNTKILTEWVKNKIAEVELYYDRRRGGEHTIFTYLRDHIHPKTAEKGFPFKEINNRLPQLQNLVYEKIKEKYRESIY